MKKVFFKIRLAAVLACSLFLLGATSVYAASHKNVDSEEIAVTEEAASAHYEQEEMHPNCAQVKVTARELYSKAWETLNLVNVERKKRGLNELAMDNTLLDTAMLRAMELSFLFSHERPSGTMCYTAHPFMMAENVGFGAISAQQMMSGWMNSPGHRGNILHPDMKGIGIGCVYYQEQYYWVQCFSPLIMSLSLSQEKDKTNTRVVQIDKNSQLYKASFKLPKTTLTTGESMYAGIYWNGQVYRNSGVIVNSSNAAVCKVEGTKIIAKAPGTATIKIYFKGAEDKALVKTVTVQRRKVNVYYNANGGKVDKTSVVMYQGRAIGTFPKVYRVGYKFNGWYTALKGGTKVTTETKVTSPYGLRLYAQWTKLSMGKTSITSLYNANGYKMKLAYSKVKWADGYQIVVSTNANFKYSKYYSIKGSSATFGNLQKNKTYYVKVRAYKHDSAGKRVYGSYSSVRKITIKK